MIGGVRDTPNRMPAPISRRSRRAERHGDRYIVNGTKTWISYAQYANAIFALVRTDLSAKQHEGISFLLIPLTLPGISVRPIVTIDGGSEINEVHFEGVEVPVDNRVGDEGAGWTYAKFLLEHERSGNAGAAQCRQQLAGLRELLANERIDDRHRGMHRRRRDRARGAVLHRAARARL